MLKTVDRVYNEIYNTPPFKELTASTEIGKEAVKSFVAEIESRRSEGVGGQKGL